MQSCDRDERIGVSRGASHVPCAYVQREAGCVELTSQSLPLQSKTGSFARLTVVLLGKLLRKGGTLELCRPHRLSEGSDAHFQLLLRHPILDALEIAALVCCAEVRVRSAKSLHPNIGDQPNVRRAHQSLPEHIDAVIW
jgi:hypothetical protein